mmetsp:Transcript_23458/g.34619  ORF Transcript_23458/g.34619 Transcript_23458/m.34619 type:complete len:759 (-) Transcript_23458:272-2548(-)
MMNDYESIPLIKKKQGHLLDDNEEEKYSAKRRVVFVLTVGFAFLVGANFASFGKPDNINTVADKKHAELTSLTMMDTRIEQWEDWKSSNFLLESSPLDPAALKNEIAQNWIHQEAEKIADWFEHTKEVWNNTEHKEAKRIRQWIEQAKHELNYTEQNVASWIDDTEHKASRWINYTEHDFSEFEQKKAEESRKWMHKTEQNAADWLNDTEHKAAEWMQHMEHDLNDTEHKEAKEIGNWINNTEHKAAIWVNDTEHKTGKWVEDLEHDLDEFEHTEAEKIGDWMNNSEHEAANLFNNAKHGTSEWINHTEHALNRMKKEESKKIRDWISHTQHLLNETEHKMASLLKDKEQETSVWINGTEHYWSELEHEEAEKIRRWINHTHELLDDTEHKAFSWLNDTEYKTSVWINHTEHVLSDVEHEEEEKIKDWIDHTEQMLNETENNAFTWLNDTEDKASEWVAHTEHLLNATEHNASSWFNTTEHKTFEWWNDVIHGKKSDLLIYMNSSSAYRLLLDGAKHGEYAQDYFLIQQGLDTQINQAYCAVAASSAIINSYRGDVDPPVDSVYDPYPYATQSDLFNNCTNQFVIHKNETYDGIFLAPGGLGMPQTKALLECYLKASLFNITTYHLDPTVISLDRFRQDMKEALLNPSGRAMVNYDRKSIGQIGGGHWSPIGAYSPHADSFLVMDVAKYKYPNVWIPTVMIYESLQTYDSCGDWNFPGAQDALKQKSFPSTKFEYTAAMETLGCQPSRRGYITIVKHS